MWRSPWVGIGQCNILIHALEGKELQKRSIRERSLGEAYFLRAHYYFVLVRLYGGVPLRLQPFTPGEPTAIARASTDEVYTQIISDCTRAIDLLPAKSELDDENVGRACKDAALTMMADIYLTLAPNHKDYYQKVADLCNQVTALGYDLSKCKFADNFDATLNNNPESIFEVQYSGNTEYDFWGNNPQSSWLSTFMGPRNSNFVAGGYGWNQPTEEFMSQWEEGDKRKDLTVFYEGCPDYEGNPYKKSYSYTGYNVRKFLVSKTVSPEYNTNPANFVVYRYADVLLMKAEALNELGQTDAAADQAGEQREQQVARRDRQPPVAEPHVRADERAVLFDHARHGSQAHHHSDHQKHDRERVAERLDGIKVGFERAESTERLPILHIPAHLRNTGFKLVFFGFQRLFGTCLLLVQLRLRLVEPLLGMRKFGGCGDDGFTHCFTRGFVELGGIHCAGCTGLHVHDLVDLLVELPTILVDLRLRFR